MTWSRPEVVVTATTRVGTTGGFSWDSAQTVSVSTAGDIPVTQSSTISGPASVGSVET
jgi:hypothetical protein